MQVTNRTWQMHKHCVPGSVSSSPAEEAGNEDRSDFTFQFASETLSEDLKFYIFLEERSLTSPRQLFVMPLQKKIYIILLLDTSTDAGVNID